MFRFGHVADRAQRHNVACLRLEVNSVSLSFQPSGRWFQDRFTEPIYSHSISYPSRGQRNDTKYEIWISENCFDTRSRGRHRDNSGRDFADVRLRFHPPAPRLRQPPTATAPYPRQYPSSRIRHSRNDGIIRARIRSHRASIRGDAPHEPESLENLGRTHTGLLSDELPRPGRLRRGGTSGDSGRHIDSKVETANSVGSIEEELHQSGRLE